MYPDGERGGIVNSAGEFVRVVVNKRQLACSENYKWAGVNKRREARKWLFLGRNASLFPRAEHQIVSRLNLALSLCLSFSDTLRHAYICFLFLALSVSPLHPVCDWARRRKSHRRGRIDLSGSIDYSTRLVLRAESWISLCFPFTVTVSLSYFHLPSSSPSPPFLCVSHLLPDFFQIVLALFPSFSSFQVYEEEKLFESFRDLSPRDPFESNHSRRKREREREREGRERDR